MFNSQRVGIAVIVVLFIIGALILRLVDEEEGKKAGGRQ